MKILALDLATKTGWACNAPAASGVQDFSLKRGESPGMRFILFNRWLKTMVKDGFDIIVYEQAHHRGGAATHVINGLIAHTERIAAENSIDITSFHSGTIKKFATGKGNAGKTEMMEAFTREQCRLPVDDNEADAYWLLKLAEEQLG